MARATQTGVYAFPDRDQQEYPAKISFQQIIMKPIDATNLIAESGTNLLDAAQTASEAATDGAPATTVNVSPGLDLQTIKRPASKSGDGPWKVELYMPQSIAFSDGANYQNVDLGAIGANIEGAVAAGTGAGAAILGAVSNEFTGLIGGIMNGVQGDAGKLAALKVASKLNDTAGAAVSSATRLALNPNTRQLFQSVPLREFSYTFQMIPESSREVDVIKNIIQSFREAIYPEEIGVGQISLAYRFPHPFEIKMEYNRRQVFSRILPSYLTAVTTTYNNQSMGFYEDGNFTDVTVGLSFRETRPLNKDDVKGGY